MGNRIFASDVLNNSETNLLDLQDSQERQTQSAEINRTSTIRPNIHIKRESVRLTQSSYLSFEYFSQEDVVINIYFFAIESLKLDGTTECYYIDTEKYPDPLQLELEGGQGMFFPNSSVNIDPSKYTKQDLTFSDNKTYPVIIEIRETRDRQTVETTYCKFVVEDGIRLKAFRQKLSLWGTSFEMQDIYGYRNDIEQDCVVCMSQEISTVVLPCRHFCLCLSCSGIVRAQNKNKCPICRKGIETLLNIRNG